ncbi:sensor histidine kinase [Pediococcus claussenii]|uniref:histidine kinase n=1 Tax=Pediococcus claussenii (strain ATCC BAA-344 / DSM 14800 / JCM 18046 / KCTC 3811 / LMG 21948 / P06) TaxID=701521 RepID=G8PCC3_PEDCP|nr:HAMP domain-containing sensor histidine kinase [Pediococcus claussenii]AEV94908.1 Two-component system, sensor histidine kinase [Pediococcus claussenii ATCC BAA-344]ANZ70104.1 two-component sensor histidine kinase [Pediococcus claussenii]ANZ71919.1 two-component sensor histidine kinase [Pediococcus claussenii]KRN18841.1 hypothetical protein IV79_GL000339 [Pediococcus claussenii]
MKLIYQEMIGFMVVIVSTLIVLGVIFINFSSSMVYRNKWSQLEGYANSLYQQTTVLDSATGNIQNFKISELQSNEKLLQQQQVHFTIIGPNNTIAYPQQNVAPHIVKAQWERLKKGKIITSKSDIRADEAGDEISMTDILKPYFNKQHKLICVVSVGSPVANIKSDIQEIRKNLYIAFALSSIVALITSFLIARYISNRIKQIQSAAHRVADGDFDVEIPIQGTDEIGDLSNDFNRMTNSLKEYDDEVKRQEIRRREFMADAAHEMRTPLTTINGILEGIQYGALPEDSKDESLELMQKETKRLIRIVNDNLDYERIRTNRVVLDRKRVDVNEIVSRIVNQLDTKAKQANDVIEKDLNSNVTAYADYDRLVQIIFNLVQNAVQFTSDGHIKVHTAMADNHTIITVEDDGIGMSEEQIKNIWERYYKADASRIQTKGESGLGMAITHQLVLAHGGSIDVKSRLNKGTKFIITLPNKPK